MHPYDRTIWTAWTTASSSAVTYQHAWAQWNEANDTRYTRQTQRALAGLQALDQQRAAQAAHAAQQARYEQQLYSEVRFINEEKQAAYEKAKALLLSCLTPEQRAMLLAQGHFEVQGHTGRRYRIKWGQAGNVYYEREDGVTYKLCCHPRTGVPDPDAMLAQKFMLETDEQAFLATANHTPIGRRAA